MNEIEFTTIGSMIGKTFTSVIQRAGNEGDELAFILRDGGEFVFYHSQDCCESVRIEDIGGDISDLVGSPILRAEEASREAANEETDDYSGTWTFYKFSTIKGNVTVRWLGTSNGYYSESVYLRVPEGTPL